MQPFDRRDLGSGIRVLVPRALEELGVLAAFFERAGGASAPPFAALNVSYVAGDDPVAVAENRARAARALGLERFTVPGLVHGTAIEEVPPGAEGDGFARPAARFAHADGLWTDRAGVALGGFSGDCVVAVMASEVEPRIALVHAGWRGLAAGIVARAAGLFSDAAAVHVALGPAIGPCHYEVGREVVDAIEAGAPGTAVAEERGGRPFLDLSATTRQAFAATGVTRVDDTGLCTACHPARLFSYRAEGRTGRHLALAVRRPGYARGRVT